jgi:hypothetical protein
MSNKNRTWRESHISWKLIWCNLTSACVSPHEIAILIRVDTRSSIEKVHTEFWYQSQNTVTSLSRRWYSIWEASKRSPHFVISNSPNKNTNQTTYRMWVRLAYFHRDDLESQRFRHAFFQRKQGFFQVCGTQSQGLSVVVHAQSVEGLALVRLLDAPLLP